MLTLRRFLGASGASLLAAPADLVGAFPHMPVTAGGPFGPPPAAGRG